MNNCAEKAGACDISNRELLGKVHEFICFIKVNCDLKIADAPLYLSKFNRFQVSSICLNAWQRLSRAS